MATGGIERGLLVLGVFALLGGGSAEAQRCGGGPPRPAPPETVQIRYGFELEMAARPVDGLALSPADADAVACVDASIAEGWRAFSMLDEATALQRLEEARRLAERSASVPAMGRWLAEVELLTAVVATSRSGEGWQRLARQALKHMASLDPRRVVRAAEAPPQLVELAEQARRAVRAAPEGAFRVEANAEGAVVFVNSERVGALPRTLRLPAGRHHVRVLAPGHLPYGAFIDVEAGEGLPMRVTLSPTPREVIRSALRDATSPLQVQAAIAATQVQVLWVETEGRRAAAVRCTGLGCGEPVRAEGDDALERVVQDAGPGEDPLAWAPERAWLQTPEPPPPTPPRPWYRRWGVWAAAATAVVIGAGAAAAALRPSRSQRFEATIDFGDLAP
ncbi:MAG: PEGA domain-containing protein [Myxococcota bacterium]